MFDAWLPVYCCGGEYIANVLYPYGSQMGRASRDGQLRADAVPSGQDDVAWESALASRIREGDSHAFALLIEQYLDRLTRFAMAMVDSRDTAEDVVQYVFVWLWESRTSIDPTRPLKSYLYRAVRNRVINERDSDKVRTHYQERIAAEMNAGTRPSSVRSPEEAVLSGEEIEYVLRQLPERRKVAVRLRYEAQLSYEEIAEALGISPQAATQLVLRGIDQLKNLLKV